MLDFFFGLRNLENNKTVKRLVLINDEVKTSSRVSRVFARKSVEYLTTFRCESKREAQNVSTEYFPSQKNSNRDRLTRVWRQKVVCKTNIDRNNISLVEFSYAESVSALMAIHRFSSKPFHEHLK